MADLEMQSNEPARLRSLDAYRGFIMLAMASSGFRLESVAKHFPDSEVWKFLGYQFSHVQWTGCSFWDLIQPSFMFMVGVALPYSHASRLSKGQPKWQIAMHTIWRSLFLIALGIFLSSNSSKQTNFTFVNVLSQIGLGYAFVYLLVGRSPKLQLLAIIAVLAASYFWFASHPLPEEGFDWKKAGIPDQEGWVTGFFAHWNKHTNFATSFDQWFLSLFPKSDMYPYNRGGYQTLNFVPSMATMILGLMAGELLRGPLAAALKLRALIFAGLWCLAIGYAMSWFACPSVKRIWTPSWAVFSTGWTFLMLAAFYGLLDVAHFRGWEFPFVVVGMNSIAMYCMSQLMSGWIGQTYRTHVGYWWGRLVESTPKLGTQMDLKEMFGTDLFGGTYGPIVQSCTVLATLWAICLWMYRRRIFIRI